MTGCTISLSSFFDEITKIAADRRRSGYRTTEHDIDSTKEPTDQEYGDEKEEVKVSQASDPDDPDFMGGDEDYFHNTLQLASKLPPLRIPSLRKRAYAVSQYSGPLSMGAIPTVSSLPPFRVPPLRKEKTAAAGIKVNPGRAVGGSGTVAGGTATVGPTIKFSPTKQLERTKNVAKVPATPPGPTIASVAKPVGYGKPMAGATKSLNA